MEDELEGVMVEIRGQDDDTVKSLLTEFYRKAQKNTLTSPEAIFREKLYKLLSWIIVVLFVGFNTIVLTVVALGFYVDLFYSEDSISGNFITPTVLVSLITATVAQTAAAFIIIAKSSIPKSDNPS